MIRWAILLFLFFFSGILLAQKTEDDGDYVSPRKPAQPWVWHENLFYGGGLGLAFGTYTAVNVNPQVGVKVAPWLGGGVGFDYNFIGNRGVNIQTVGPTAFARVRPFDFLISQVEVTRVFVRERYNTYESRYQFPAALAGIGYQDGDRESGGFFVMIMWDLIDDEKSPFQTPIFRAGFSMGF